MLFKVNIKNSIYFFPVECDTWLYYFWLWEECAEIFFSENPLFQLF